MARRILIFDTTLRDGEQSPGISLNVREKVEIAEQLARMEVDVIEAGFPISSRGDFEAVKAIAKTVKGPSSAPWPGPRGTTSTGPGSPSCSRSGHASIPSSPLPNST